MALKHMMINDIISEHGARMRNLKKYYPFFVLNETTFAQYKDGKYMNLDMGYITMASLRFFINENNFHERDVTYEEYEDFLLELLHRDFSLEEPPEEERQLVGYIFDKLKNEGRAFEFRFYEPEEKKSKVARVKLLDSRIEQGQVFYNITAEGIEFYLDTKEIKDESKINVSQLLLEKMISANNFKGGIDVVKRINSQVISLIEQKNAVVKLLSVDVFEGAKAYESYMQTTAKWFSEEQKLFAKNKALVDKAIEKASFENKEGERSLRSRALEEISQLETELKKTIYNHSRLIGETTELSQMSDRIIGRAKLRKLRPVFDFRECLLRMMSGDSPADMAHILFPLFAPKIEKRFSMHSIDNLLTLKPEDKTTGEKVEHYAPDFDFRYEDEILEARNGANFARMFYELCDQVKKWNEVSLRELNGIFEIKFGKEIYGNRDYYAFLVHLAGKKTYSLGQMVKKQDTILEEMAVTYMSEDEKKKLADLEFDISFGAEEIPLTSYLTEQRRKQETETEIEAQPFSVTDMTFIRREG